MSDFSDSDSERYQVSLKRPPRRISDDSRPSKKFASVRNFLDLDAQVQDDDEDDEDEDFYDREFVDDEEDELPPISNYHEPPLVIESKRQSRLDKVAERYAKPKEMVLVDTTMVSQQSLLPTVSDPKIWRIKCKEGREFDAVKIIMRKFISMCKNNNDDLMPIFSVFARSNVKGTVYVEAKNLDHVKAALSDITILYPRNALMIPIKEMADLLTINSDDKAAELLRREWVRLKRGKYAGDLARVLEVNDAGMMCKVAVIPRLDLNAMARGEKQAHKPPQRLFNRRDVPQNLTHLVLPRANGYCLFGKEMYKDGLLEKLVSTNALDLDAAPPTLDELNKFTRSDGKIDPKMLESIKQSIKETLATFRVGDEVQATEGDLQFIPSVITAIDGNTATIAPIKSGTFAAAKVLSKDLAKVFKLGDTVRVASGRHSAQVGTIVHLDGKIATLITLDSQEIKVFVHDIQEMREVKDNVAVPQVKSGFKKPKAFNRDSIVGSTVKVMEGPYKGYLGIVKRSAGNMVHVELHTNCKVLTILREKVAVRDESGAFEETEQSWTSAWSSAWSAQPESGSRTPCRPDEDPDDAWNVKTLTPPWKKSTPSWQGQSYTPVWRPN